MKGIIESPIEGELQKITHPDIYHLYKFQHAASEILMCTDLDETSRDIAVNNAQIAFANCLDRIKDKELNISFENMQRDIDSFSEVSCETLSKLVGKILVHWDAITIHHKQALMAYGPDLIRVEVDLAKGKSQTGLVLYDQSTGEFVDVSELEK